jgi:teichuronic acid biosynthesis glycosyltransferase TuaC
MPAETLSRYREIAGFRDQELVRKSIVKSLFIITHGYPCNANRISQPFTREFAHAVARQGVKVTVIAPLAIHLAWRGRDPLNEVEVPGGGLRLEVFRPRYLSVSDWQLWKWNARQIALESFCWAARRVLRRLVVPRPAALYGHFLYLGGAAATRLGVEMGIPAFTMVGDGQLNSVEGFGIERARRDFSAATGFLPNSSCLAGLLREQLGVGTDRIGVFPNGINHGVFFPRDKTAMRGALGLPKDRFLVICVGHQDVQKGPARVGEAIRGLAGVGGIFLGSGPQPPQSDNIIFNQPVPHDQVPKWLSAADVFVLPSTFEGCCNGALEAMACGLPVIGSEGDFNDDILNPQVSIRTGPLDVPAIRNAIIRLRDDVDLRARMGNAALKWSETFDADVRARRILEFMVARIAQHEVSASTGNRKETT